MAKQQAEERRLKEERKAFALQHADELEFRKAELRLSEQGASEELELRRAEIARSSIRDEQTAEREKSLAAQTKKYGDIMKYVLPRMPADPGELLTYWETCENLWEVYEVPENLRAQLLIPLLAPKAKTLVGRLSGGNEMADVNVITKFLLQEFKLTSREYRAHFMAATHSRDETRALFISCLKNLWGFYMRNREGDSLEKLTDMVIADRLKDTLSGPCLK